MGREAHVPEGNEVHRYAKLHAATYVGKTICVESPNGRFPGAALLTGRKLKSVHYVYRRHGRSCFVCGATIQREDLAGRTLYWCPTCQAPEQ
jgi:formamidopyrimidine-DNA glycosylase